MPGPGKSYPPPKGSSSAQGSAHHCKRARTAAGSASVSWPLTIGVGGGLLRSETQSCKPRGVGQTFRLVLVAPPLYTPLLMSSKLGSLRILGVEVQTSEKWPTFEKHRFRGKRDDVLSSPPLQCHTSPLGTFTINSLDVTSPESFLDKVLFYNWFHAAKEKLNFRGHFNKRTHNALPAGK